MLIPLRSQRSSRRNPSYPLPCAMQGPVWLAHGDSENGAEGSTWEQAKGVVPAVLTLAVGARIKHPPRIAIHSAASRREACTSS
jgi:hypothetical protein